MGFIETSYGNSPNLSDVHIDSNLNMDTFGISAGGAVNFSGGLDLNNTDLVGVKRFMCSDYLGALLAVASDNVTDTVILDNAHTTKKFRIPSNFITGSKIKIQFYFKPILAGQTATLYKYDPDTETSTSVYAYAATSNSNVWVTSSEISVNAGEIYYFSCNGSSTVQVLGEFGIKMCYDPNAVSGAVWEVINE